MGVPYFAPYIPSPEGRGFTARTYKGLDGNGMVEELFERFRKLPHVRLENERK